MKISKAAAQPTLCRPHVAQIYTNEKYSIVTSIIKNYTLYVEK